MIEPEQAVGDNRAGPDADRDAFRSRSKLSAGFQSFGHVCR
jgi:hypothetical protein